MSMAEKKPRLPSDPRPPPPTPLGHLVPNVTPEATGKPRDDDKPFDFFTGAMKVYWQTGHFSDLVMSVNGYNVRAHRMVICSQSPFLSYLVHSLYVKDKKAKTIKIPDTPSVNLNAFKAMIGWMYGVDYIPPGDECKTYIHAGMYEMAVRFHVPRLRVHALKRVKQSTEVPDAEFDAKAFLKLVNVEMANSRSHMRRLLMNICRKKIELLLKEPALDDVIRNYRPYFGTDLMRILGKEPEVRCLECSSACDEEGRCANDFCPCEEDWRPYFT